MAKLRTIQTNFSSGEFSPQAAGRVDIARYNNGAKSMVNVICRTLGGAKKRPGTQYLAATKYPDKKARLIPYIISRNEAYMLELGDLYGRIFYTDGTPVTIGTIPLTFTTPYTADQVFELDYSQGEYGMYLFHGEIFPHLIKSSKKDSWACAPVQFLTLPFDEVGEYPGTAIDLASTAVGTGVAAFAYAPAFLDSDVGRAIIWRSGIAIITAYTDTQNVTVEIKAEFENTYLVAGEWNLDSSPQTTITASAPTFASPAMDPVGSPITLTLSAAGFRTTDAGKYVQLNGGLVQIDTYTDSTHVDGTIIQELTSIVAVPALAWTLEGPVWNPPWGYPRTGTFHEQRLVCASTKKNPQTVWGSRSGNELDFTKGPNDDDSFAFTIAGNDSQINQVNFLVSERVLLALSYGGEFSITGGTEKPITPTNVHIQMQTPYGSKPVRPVQVGRQTLFVQRAGRKVRAMNYSFQDDGYSSTDLTTLAEHITK